MIQGRGQDGKFKKGHKGGGKGHSKYQNSRKQLAESKKERGHVRRDQKPTDPNDQRHFEVDIQEIKTRSRCRH